MRFLQASLESNDPEGYDDDGHRYDGTNKLEPDFEDTPNEMAENIKTNLSVPKEAHSDVTNIMIEQNDTALEDYAGPDIPIVMVYIDDDILVIGLDPVAMLFDPPIEPELMQHILDIDEAVEITYVEFTEEASASQTRSWQDKYGRDCQPVKAGYQKACKVYGDIMKRLGISLPSGITNAPQTTTTATQGSSPCDDSPRGTACYYYKQYEKRCTDGKSHKRCGTYSAIIESAGYQVPLGGNAPVPQPPSYDLKNVKAKMGSNGDVTVTWDRPAGFEIKKYRVYTYADGRYLDRTTVDKSSASYTLSDAQEGKTYKFKVKMYYYEQDGGSRTFTKSYHSNTVEIPRTVPPDVTPPAITVPEDLTVNSTSDSGMSVEYQVYAIDETDGRISPQCTHASGTNFDVGTTRVECSAADAAGNTSTAFFDVIVQPAKGLGRAVLSLFATVYYGAIPIPCVHTLIPDGTITVLEPWPLVRPALKGPKA